jgi:hypothetical protein
VHQPSALFLDRPPTELIPPPPPPPPPLPKARKPRKKSIVYDDDASEQQASRFAFVCEGPPPMATSRAFVGLLGTISSARQPRDPTKWWIVVHLKTPTRPRRFLTPGALLDRIKPHHRIVAGSLIDSTAHAAAFASLVRNMRRAQGFTHTPIVFTKPT